MAADRNKFDDSGFQPGQGILPFPDPKRGTDHGYAAIVQSHELCSAELDHDFQSQRDRSNPGKVGQQRTCVQYQQGADRDFRGKLCELAFLSLRSKMDDFVRRAFEPKP